MLLESVCYVVIGVLIASVVCEKRGEKKLVKNQEQKVEVDCDGCMELSDQFGVLWCFNIVFCVVGGFDLEKPETITCISQR